MDKAKHVIKSHLILTSQKDSVHKILKSYNNFKCFEFKIFRRKKLLKITKQKKGKSRCIWEM